MLAEQLEDSPICMGTVAIVGPIREDTPLVPGLAAEAYYQHYKQGVPQIELVFSLLIK